MDASPQEIKVRISIRHTKRALTVSARFASAAKPLSLARFLVCCRRNQTRLWVTRRVRCPLGDKYIDEITPESIQEFVNKRKHLAHSYLDEILRLLNLVLNNAVSDEYISKKPTSVKGLVVKGKPEKAQITHEETSFR